MDTFLEILKKATNIQPLLDQFKSGRVLRRTLSVIYRIVAVLMGLALLWFWIRSWEFIGDLNFFGGLAFLIWQISFPYAAFLAIKVLYLRAREIKDSPDSDYVVVPVMAMLLKTNGEMIFIFLAVMSLPAMLLTWLGGSTVLYMLDLDVGNIFFGGILVFLMSWVIGFSALIFAQFLAEWTLALFSIAGDVSILRRNSVSGKKECIPETSAPSE